MTIDEAIKQFKYDAECNRADLDLSYAEDNEQIAKWLEELKDYRDKNKTVVRIDCANSEQFKDIAVKLAKEQYNKAIDDFVKFANTMPTVETEDGEIRPMWLEEMAERLKVGGDNE